MPEVLHLAGKFGQLSASYAANSVGIPSTDLTANYALRQSFNILVPEFQKDTPDPLAAREEVINFLYKHLAGRYSLFQQYLPEQFPIHDKNRRDAMTFALVADACIARMHPNDVAEEFDKNLILLSYEMFSQADELITCGSVDGHPLPESMYLAQIDGLDNLDVIESYLPSYSLEDISKKVNRTLLSLAHLVDVATPVGQALHQRLVTVSDKVDAHVSAMPTLSVVG